MRSQCVSSLDLFSLEDREKFTSDANKTSCSNQNTLVTICVLFVPVPVPVFCTLYIIYYISYSLDYIKQLTMAIC